MLNELYTLFDALCDAKRIPNIYKVETVGDKYMAVSGLPENCDSHAKWIAKLALSMMDVAKNVRMGNEPLVDFIFPTKFTFLIEISLVFTENYNRYSFWRSRYRSNWQPDAKILSFW